MLVTDALTAYAKEHGPEVIGKETMANAISALTSFWQGRTVADVIPQTCKHYVATRQPRSNGTTRRELGTLQAAINWQYRSGRLTRPVIVTFPEAPTGRKRWLTRQEAAALLRASRTKKARLYIPLFILIGIYTGRRKEAILSLRWPQVDLKAKLIDFELPGRDTTNKRRGAVPMDYMRAAAKAIGTKPKGMARYGA
jgi:integrase